MNLASFQLLHVAQRIEKTVYTYARPSNYLGLRTGMPRGSAPVEEHLGAGQALTYASDRGSLCMLQFETSSREPMLKTSTISLALLLGTLPVHAQTFFGSDTNGNTWNATRIGNQTFGSDSSGRTFNSTQIGGNTFGSDSNGTTYNSTRIGNTTFGSDSNGNTWNANQIGGTTFINRSDGSMTTCNRIGNQTLCN